MVDDEWWRCGGSVEEVGEMRPIYRNKHHMNCHMIEDKY
jgi:hypothetical protein